MRSDPLSPVNVMRALELFGPQARPYNLDDCFDCWGLVRRVFDHLDGGYEIDERLGAEGDPHEKCWVRFEDPGELVPGDVLTTHRHADDRFHTVFFCGRVDGLDLVYDASPRGSVPLFTRERGVWRRVAERPVFTRYMRATETTDRLRHDGGAYLRLWDDRVRFYDHAVHQRLLAGGAAEERDLVALRRSAGLSDLPFYCRRRLLVDAAGREVYDNRPTRHLDYYVPDGAPVMDDDYEGFESGEAPAARRPPAPRLEQAPLWVVDGGQVTVTWRFGEERAAAPPSSVTGCRVELWEETWDLWKHRLLRLDLDSPATCFTVPGELLHADSRFAVVVWARGPGGFSGATLAPFLYRPAPGNPLLAYNPVRPDRLAPDGGATVEAGSPVELTWHIRERERSQASAEVAVYEDGCLTDGRAPVFATGVDGPAADACRVIVPGGRLRAGHTYSWYVTVQDAGGRAAFAPAEGVFAVTEKG